MRIGHFLGRRLLFFAFVCLTSTSCNPIYVAQAGLAELEILRAREPIPDLILSPETDERTRGKLTLVREARAWAVDHLEMEVGDTYTTVSDIGRDTLAMVLSGARRDRLEPKTWWFPIVGRVPYRGYFSLDGALDAQQDLEKDGYDTYLRPTSAFSTLGWFSDPITSPLLRADEVALVETIIHELSHNHLFVKGQVRFNESFANFVGLAGSAEFFCTRPGGGSVTVWCLRAQNRWADAQRFSTFVDHVVDELTALYERTDLTSEQKIELREEIFVASKEEFRTEVQPQMSDRSFQFYLTLPLNNATLLARLRYYHRLTDFQDFLERQGGSMSDALRIIKDGVGGFEDPYQLFGSI